MSFRWQFGCGCNLDQPETCGPILIYRSIKLSDLYEKLLKKNELAKVGLLIVRLQDVPLIKKTTTNGYNFYSVTNLTNLNTYANYSVAYQKAEEALSPETLIQEMFIRHYQSNNNSAVSSFVFQDYLLGSRTSNPYNTIRNTIDYLETTCWVPPRKSSVAYFPLFQDFLDDSFNVMRQKWGDPNVAAIQCCAAPATTPRASSRPTGSAPLTLVADIRTGRVEWNRTATLTLETPADYYSSDGSDFSNTIINPVYRKQSEKTLDSMSRGTFEFAIEKSFASDEIFPEEDSVDISLFKTNDDLFLRTGFATYSNQVNSGSGSSRRYWERNQSKFSIRRVIDADYDTANVNKTYTLDFQVDWWWNSHNRPISNLSGRYNIGKGAFGNDPRLNDNPHKVDYSNWENITDWQGNPIPFSLLTFPDAFFQQDVVKFKISYDFIVKRAWEIVMYGNATGLTGTFSDILDGFSNEDRSNVFGYLMLQSPVEFWEDSVRLRYKKANHFTGLGRPTYNEQGTASAYEEAFSYNANLEAREKGVFPRYLAKIFSDGTYYSGIDPNWNLASYFDSLTFFRPTLYSDGTGSLSTYQTLTLPFSQDFFDNQIDTSRYPVTVYCEGQILPGDYQDACDDFYSCLDYFFQSQTKTYQVPVQCWTDNLFCVDIKRQFFDENGERVNLVESNPD